MKPLYFILCLVFWGSRLWAAEHPLDNNTSGPAHLDSASEDFRRVWKGMLGGDDYLRALKATGMADALVGSRGQRGHAPKDLQTWTRTGPVGGFGNSGDNGRVAGLALVNVGGQDFVYVGACSGGLWRAEVADLGVWQNLGDGLPNPSVRAFAVNPANPQRIVVGTGDWSRYKGAGMFLTTDNGATWNPIPLDPTPEHFYRIRHAPNNPQVMMAASDNGLWRSMTSGDQWTQVEWGDWTDLVLHPSDPNVMYAVAKAAGIYRSTNQGVNWTQLTSPNLPPLAKWGRASLAICRDFPSFVAVMVENGGNVLGVYRTPDDGTTWEDISANLAGASFGGGQADHAQALAFQPNDRDELFLGADKLIYYFSQPIFGFKWSPAGFAAGHDDYTQLVFSPTDDTVLWLANDGGLYRSSGGNDAQSANGNPQRGLAISQVAGFDANRSMIALGLQDNGILRTVDAAQTWDRLTTGDGASVQITDPEHRDLWFWDGQYKDVPWHPKRAVFGQSIEDLPFPTGCIDMFHYDLRADRVWAAADQSVYSTAENSDPVTWSAEIVGGLHTVPNYGLRTLWGSKIESGTLAVSFNTDLGGDLAVVHKQGGTWMINLTTNLVPGALGCWVWAATPSREWPGEWWACLHGRPGDPKILHTTDYGQTWQDISGVLTNLETVFAVVPTPFDPLKLYAATSLGVFRSLDGGKTWAPFQEGLPIVEVRGMTFVVDPTHTSVHKLRIGTYGRGTWERDIPAPPIIYVDRDNHTGVEDGTLEHPYSTIAKGVAAAPVAAIVAIRANTYTEPQTLTNAVTLMTYAGTTVVN